MLSSVIRRYFPTSEIIKQWRPQGGMSADLTAVELKTDGHLHRIMVRQIETAAREFNLLTLLQSAGVIAPAPLVLDESCTLLPKPFLILKFIDGEPRYDLADPVRIGQTMGEQLAKIHAVDTHAFALSFLPAGQSRLMRPIDHPADGDIRAVLEPIWPLPQTEPPVLMHGDFWPGNLLWRGSELTGVIDWEDAKIGSRLQDLAISRFDVAFIFGREAMRSLTESYRQHLPIPADELPFWDLFAALRAAHGIPEWAPGWPGLGRPDLTQSAIWDAHAWFTKQAMDKIS